MAVQTDASPASINAGSQSEVVFSSDAAVQWSPADIPIADDLLISAAGAIDSAIGFSDKKLTRPDLKVRAQHLIANGHSHIQIQSLAGSHWEKIDDIRPGDSLTRLCGDRWLMEGNNGRSYLSDGSTLRVTSIGDRGYVQGRCPLK